MTIQLAPALNFDLAILADVFTRGFEGYFVPIAETPAGLASRLRYDTIDLAASQVALIDGRPCGVIFVAVRGWAYRIAGMGVAMEARRQGLGRRLMEAVIEHGRTAGVRSVVLEVIEQNEPAVKLYRSLGFEAWRRLVGFEASGEELAQARGAARELDASRDAATLTSVEARLVGHQIAREAAFDLPWQLAAETFGARGVGLPGYTLQDKAFALMRAPQEGPLVLEALLVKRSERRRKWGSRLVHALASQHSGRAMRVPPRLPDELADAFFETLGFHRSPICQLEMKLVL